jgi:hypothetical protein
VRRSGRIAETLSRQRNTSCSEYSPHLGRKTKLLQSYRPYPATLISIIQKAWITCNFHPKHLNILPNMREEVPHHLWYRGDGYNTQLKRFLGIERCSKLSEHFRSGRAHPAIFLFRFDESLLR